MLALIRLKGEMCFKFSLILLGSIEMSKKREISFSFLAAAWRYEHSRKKTLRLTDKNKTRLWFLTFSILILVKQKEKPSWYARTKKKKPRRNLFIPPKYHYFKITPPPPWNCEKWCYCWYYLCIFFNHIW